MENQAASVSSVSSQLDENLITAEWTVNQSAARRRSSWPNTELDKPAVGNIANVKFSSMDLILNLKTWVELLHFIHHLKPQSHENVVKFGERDSFDENTRPNVSESAYSAKKMGNTDSADDKTMTDEADTEINVMFSELNILLMRHIETTTRTIGRKVTTLSMHDTRVHAFFGDDVKHKTKDATQLQMSVNADGSVGGLALQDLTNAVRDERGVLRGMQVLCLGHFPDRAGTAIPGRVFDHEADHEAFKFSMQKGTRKKAEVIDRRWGKDECTQFSMDEDACCDGMLFLS